MATQLERPKELSASKQVRGIFTGGFLGAEVAAQAGVDQPAG